MSPDALELRAFLALVSRRRAWIAAGEGAAAGISVSVLAALVGWPPGGVPMKVFVAVSLAAIGAMARTLWVSRRTERPSQLVERRAPQCRNVVITAGELLARPTAASGYVSTIVWQSAANTVRALDASALVPSGRALALFFTSVLLLAFTLARTSMPAFASLSATPSGIANPLAGIDRVDVTISPPAYANRPAQTVRNPNHIEALVGSRIQLSVHASGRSVSLETVTGTRPLASATDALFTGDVLADADGYIGLRVTRANGSAASRVLIGLTVTPDRPPVARISAPGRDTTLVDPHTTLDVRVDASDDIGLSSLRLRYTRVSGSGERYTFVEGETPLDIVQHDPTAWTGHVRWALDSLALTPGDMVVYRVLATDHRPGAPPSESDAFIAQLASPGGNAAAGFALDPDEQRYAVSEQMVILKSERLLAQQSRMSHDEYVAASQDLGAEQRKVRAEFVFMMGGEIADAPAPNGDMTSLNEVAEAAGESDLAAGRMFNQGRVSLQAAIRSMSRASAALTTAAVDTALPHEREALRQLEGAFSRARIILRALTQPERLDLTRRLTGTLADVTRDVHPSADPPIGPEILAVRRVLAAIASLAGDPRLDAKGSPRVSALAESTLQIAAADSSLQSVASMLDSAATALGSHRVQAARDLLDRSTTSLAAELRQRLVDAPPAPPTLRGSSLAGSLTDALRHAGATP